MLCLLAFLLDFPSFISSYSLGGVFNMRRAICAVASSESSFLVMAGTWDIPPSPEIGDATEDIIFTSVGRALTRWEEFEAVFASLFLALIDSEDNNAAASRAYGSVLTFRGRADMVRAAAEVHFSLFPDPEVERKFDAFVNELTNHACARRNEIAHGVVRSAATLITKDDGTVARHYCLYPPYYAANKNRLNRMDTNEGGLHVGWFEAKYVYSSVEIDRFAEAFRALTPRLVTIMGPMLLRRKRPAPAPLTSP